MSNLVAYCGEINGSIPYIFDSRIASNTECKFVNSGPIVNIVPKNDKYIITFYDWTMLSLTIFPFNTTYIDRILAMKGKLLKSIYRFNENIGPRRKTNTIFRVEFFNLDDIFYIDTIVFRDIEYILLETIPKLSVTKPAIK